MVKKANTKMAATNTQNITQPEANENQSVVAAGKLQQKKKICNNRLFHIKVASTAATTMRHKQDNSFW